MIGQGKISNQEASYPAPNGRKWALCNYNFNPYYLAYNNGIWLSADMKGEYYSSKDGINWNLLTIPSIGPNDTCIGMFSSGGNFFIYSKKDYNQIYFTKDGISWGNIVIKESTNTTLKKIYSSENDILLILLGNGNLKIVKNWRSSSSTPIMVASSVNDLEYYNGKFVAATSTAGIIFNEACNLAMGWHGTETDMNLNYTSITHKGKYWYTTQVTSNGETGDKELCLIYSLDCANWTKAQISSSNSNLTISSTEDSFFNIEYGNGIYTAVASDINCIGDIFTSTDGINFERKGINNYYSQRIKYINGVFIYAGNGLHKVKYSLNGKDLFDTNILPYNTEIIDYIEDEHKGVIVGVFQNQLFYSLTDGTQKNFYTPPKIVSWANGTTEEISMMLKAHYAGKINVADYWKVGDVRKEQLNAIPSGTTGESQSAQEISLVIIGINHDDLKNKRGNVSKAAITVQTLNCLSTKGYISSDYAGPQYALWSISQRRTWCNNDFINALSTLKGLIKPVVKLSNRHADSKYSSSRQQETTEDYAFLLSQWEVWGSQQITSSYGTLPAEGNQYEYMKTNSNRIKSIGSSTDYWWTRSSHVNNNNYAWFALVNTSGSYDYNNIADENSGIAPAFCL